jgi:4-amino-4-deoxy-L-arabinose transferase-like glycosyltransferase
MGTFRVIEKGSRPAMPQFRFRSDWLLLIGFCGYLFFFGLNYFGLIGADEPRYAQIAREMLARHDWITPVLGGRAWLEKPVLYYWQAMISYRLFGVSDWAARLPSAFDATLMVASVYLFLRKFRPGFHLDGALMTAATAGVIGFAHAASTDMPLTATFTIALLAWYAWHESEDRIYLAGFYFFLALGVLAKGPVAVVLATFIITAFAAAHRDYRLVWRTLWIPGIILFFVVALPWYVLVQIRNPDFFRVFVLQHNLARFGTDLYHHTRPFWYYAPVLLLGMLPWTVLVCQALLETMRAWWNEGTKMTQSEDAFNIFLVLWLLIPALFFSLSQSKLPGYILPGLPAASILLSEYVRHHVTADDKPSLALVVLHSLAASLPIIPALTLQFILLQHHRATGTPAVVSAIVAALLTVGIAATLRSNFGLRMLRFVTLVPVVLTVAAILKVGGRAIDETYSVRPLAAEIARVEAGTLPTAVFRMSREVDYGLGFYRNQVISNYDRGEIPARDHVLVVPQSAGQDLARLLPHRRVSFLGNFPPQGTEFYWISAPGPQTQSQHQH